MSPEALRLRALLAAAFPGARAEVLLRPCAGGVYAEARVATDHDALAVETFARGDEAGALDDLRALMRADADEVVALALEALAERAATHGALTAGELMNAARERRERAAAGRGEG